MTANTVLNLPDYNNTNYPLAVANQLKTIKYTKDIAKQLRYNQHIPKEFYTRSSHIRGILLAHAMGQGKTRIAVAIAEHCRINEPERNIIILLPKSLQSNFTKSIKEYNITSNSPDTNAIDSYTFVSLNSSRMYKKIKQVNKTEQEIVYEKHLGEFMDDINQKNSLTDSLLIIDEAHNFFNAITNGSTNAMGLYDLIMTTVNLKLIFLTGTPIINDPFELVPCFNMLRGLIEVNDDKTEYTRLFSEDKTEFEEYFVDREKGTIKNKEKFANRIYGLTSYYGDLYFPPTKKREGFPIELKTIVERIPMSQTQFSAYNTARVSEIDETKKSFAAAGSRFSSSSGGSSTYRVKSRQISNYVIPDYALGPMRGKKSRTKYIDKIKLCDLRDVAQFSPKMEKMLSNIKKRGNELGIVYSQFVTGEGLVMFGKVLSSHGWDNISDALSTTYDKQSKRPLFAIVSGRITPSDRAKLIDKFNSSATPIRLILLSGAVAEGINLLRVRHVHIMEPFWNYARINQVKTRAIRFNSHADLPPKDQNVQVYIYLSDYPTKYPEKKIKEMTTDVELYNKSIANMQIINSFMLTLAETSIDCVAHHSLLSSDIKKTIKCKLCSPNDTRLFYPLLKQDMTMPNTCTPYKATKIKVHEVIINGTSKYYYTKENDVITLYIHNKKLNGYMPMQRSHSYYGRLIEQILNEGDDDKLEGLD